MVVLLAIQQYNAVVVCFYIVFNLGVLSVRSDGRPWKSEVVGSNPTTQTSLLSVSKQGVGASLLTKNE